MIVNREMAYQIKKELDIRPMSQKEDSTDAKNKKLMSIRSKLKRGKRLTQSELAFLQENDLTLYQTALRVMREREALEAQLKKCKTKEDVTAVIGNAFSHLNEKDPDVEYITSAKQDAIAEYRKSDTYEKLPSKAENKKKEKEPKWSPSGLYNRHGKLNS